MKVHFIIKGFKAHKEQRRQPWGLWGETVVPCAKVLKNCLSVTVSRTGCTRMKRHVILELWKCFWNASWTSSLLRLHIFSCFSVHISCLIIISLRCSSDHLHQPGNREIDGEHFTSQTPFLFFFSFCKLIISYNHSIESGWVVCMYNKPSRHVQIPSTHALFRKISVHI